MGAGAQNQCNHDEVRENKKMKQWDAVKNSDSLEGFVIRQAMILFERFCDED